MSKPDNPNLKALKKVWYQKLKESGFEDIEDVHSPREYLKTWHSHYFENRYTPETFASKAEYYQRAARFLYEYHFEWFEGSTLVNHYEREIWRMHSEGMSFREIANNLIMRGISTNKDKVNKVVVKLIDIMRKFPMEADEATVREFDFS